MFVVSLFLTTQIAKVAADVGRVSTCESRIKIAIIMMALNLSQRIKGALFGMAVADALAMPSHWFYDRSFLKSTFGKITGFLAAPSFFPNSILNKSNTGGPGRGGFQSNLVGQVILKGKKHFWARDKSYHYHYGMQAGDNTLDMQVLRVLLRSLTAEKGFNLRKFLENYVQFMTTPDSHNDIYAGSAHRLFFMNYVKKKELQECAGNDGHNVDATDGLLNAVPLFFLYINSPKRSEMMGKGILSLRKSEILCQYGKNLEALMADVISGKSVKQAAQAQAKQFGIKLNQKQDPMTACYIDDNYLSLLHFLNKYEDSESAMLANANAGGQNVARGALIGCVFGLSQGSKKVGEWAKKLRAFKQLQKQIEQFCSLCSQMSQIK